MGLFNLSTKNVKRNFKNYSVYFISIVFNVLIYFTFMSIKYNKEFGEALKTNKVISSSFELASIILIMFAVIFIGYSTSFFMKKRKKELGLYSLLGIKKSQIGFMLFYENVIMGILAIIIGIFLGSLLFKGFIFILLKLMGLNMAISFSLSLEAVKSTVIMFGVMFFFISLYGYSIIYRYKLIDLFKAEKVVEKTPKSNKFIAILSIIFIVGGYIIGLTTESSSASFTTHVPTTLFFVVIGTYLFFGTFLTSLFKMLRKNERFYFKGTRLIEISNFSYKIKSNSRILSTIVIMTATTIVTLGSVYSSFNLLNNNIEDMQPFSYTYISEGADMDKEVERIIAGHPDNKVINKYELQYVESDVKAEGAKSNNEKLSVVSESNANKLLKARKSDVKIKLSKDTDVTVMDFDKKRIKRYKDKEIELNLEENNNYEEKSTYKVENTIKLPIVDAGKLMTTVVAKDDIYNSIEENNDVKRVMIYNVANEMTSDELTLDLLRYLPVESQLEASSTNNSIKTLNSLMIFIAFFLGLVFLISTGSIIYFRQLTDASESIERYNILKRIGVSKKEIKKSVNKQVLAIFAIPLSLGILHSLIALVMVSNIMLHGAVAMEMVYIILAYTVIYMIYYFITARGYNKIVNN
ncbi:ABC transporter permease [Peptostreptococcus faecalis]|uniref:ABC transporter permease n=1 Tax=Peptostreptococcus faecalis TaxID=2045015 RepID=UPI0015E114A1|nr:ABC transporter permease [Peptostreptococcus faecalis]